MPPERLEEVGEEQAEAKMSRMLRVMLRVGSLQVGMFGS